MKMTMNDTIWISMAGYDAGYIYEYQTEQTSEIPYRFKMVDDADDIEISTYVYKYLLVFQNYSAAIFIPSNC